MSQSLSFSLHQLLPHTFSTKADIIRGFIVANSQCVKTLQWAPSLVKENLCTKMKQQIPAKPVKYFKCLAMCHGLELLSSREPDVLGER